MTEVNEKHDAFRADMVEVLRKHQDLTPIEMVAVTSQFLGQLIAMQDQKKYTADQVMAMVVKNIEIGNESAIEMVESAGGAEN